MANFNLGDYVMVNERIERFYKKHPKGSIQTRVLKIEDGFVLMQARVYRDREDKKPTTGHAYEKEGKGFVNKTSYIENCETSAVGRALAMMGFEISKSIASREEMEKVQRMSVVKKLSAKQIKSIKSLLNKIDYPESKFLKVMKSDSIDDIPAVKYEAIMKSLKSKQEDK